MNISQLGALQTPGRRVGVDFDTGSQYSGRWVGVLWTRGLSSVDEGSEYPGRRARFFRALGRSMLDVKLEHSGRWAIWGNRSGLLASALSGNIAVSPTRAMIRPFATAFARVAGRRSFLMTSILATSAAGPRVLRVHPKVVVQIGPGGSALPRPVLCSKS